MVSDARAVVEYAYHNAGLAISERPVVEIEMAIEHVTEILRQKPCPYGMWLECVEGAAADIILGGRRINGALLDRLAHNLLSRR